MSRLLLLMVFLISFSYAQDDGGFVEEDAHVHGAALLNLALEAESLVLEFISPAYNLVGFEYQPNSEEEKAIFAQAIAQLEDANTLFVINSASQCALHSVVIESSIAEGHVHEALFGEDMAINAGHARKHMAEGPIKSVIALSDQNTLLYRAEGTHTRFDVSLPATSGYFEYLAAEDGDYVFFTNSSTLDLQLLSDEGMVAAEMVAEGEHLRDAEDMFVQALVFELEAGVHRFMIHDAGMDLVQMVIEVESHHLEHHDEEHDEAEEHDEHSDEMHEEHHEEHDHDSETHSEFHANYEFFCSQPGRLESVNLSTLFALFPNLKDLDVQYVLPSGQGLEELNATSAMLRFE